AKGAPPPRNLSGTATAGTGNSGKQRPAGRSPTVQVARAAAGRRSSQVPMTEGEGEGVPGSPRTRDGALMTPAIASPLGEGVGRHVGPDAAEQARMLAVVGYSSLAELAAGAVPDSIRLAPDGASGPVLAVPEACTEHEV